MQPNQQIIRLLVRGAYDLQHLRIEAGNRLCAAFRSKLGLDQQEKEEEKPDAEKVLKELRMSFKKLTDGVKKELPDKRKFVGDSIISDYTELALVHSYLALEARENAHFRQVEKALEDVPIYTEFLDGVAGCGPAMSGVIVSEFDPHKARHCSGFWKFAGLDVVLVPYGTDETGKEVVLTQNEAAQWEAGQRHVVWRGEGRSRKKHHLVKVKYLDKDKKEQERDSITFSPVVKTKLYVLAGCLLKAGNETYAPIYYSYKNRLEQHPNWKDKTKGHRHAAAMRYMLKMFLRDLYVAWRTLEGLEVSEPYEVAKLGMKPHGQNAVESAA